MDDHLTRDLFRAIHKGWRNPGDLAAIALAHLFELCPRCRHEFESWRAELGEGVAAPEGQDFDAVFDRMRAPAAANDGSAAALEIPVEAGQKRARSRAEELLALPPTSVSPSRVLRPRFIDLADGLDGIRHPAASSRKRSSVVSEALHRCFRD